MRYLPSPLRRPSLGPSSLLIAWLFLAFGCGGVRPERTPADYLSEGIAYFDQGDLESARVALHSALDGDPGLARGWLYLFRTELARADWASAFDTLGRGLNQLPAEDATTLAAQAVDATVQASAELLRAGRTQAAVDSLAEALKRFPESAELARAWRDTALTYAERLLQSREFRAAIEQFARVLERAPDLLEAYLGMAKALLHSGEFRRALEALRQALGLDPNSEKVHQLMREALGA